MKPLLFALAILLAGCGREQPQPPPPEEQARFDPRPVSESNGTATWYDVPENSTAARRADPGALTAAHNKFELGSWVRVVNRKNNRTVIVQITDRGVPSDQIIDLCKEAAEKIDLVGPGRVKVRIQLLRERE